MKSSRLRGCAILSLSLVALWMTHAAAGPAITASIDSPRDGVIVSGTVDVAGSAHSAAGVKRIEISIDSFGVTSKEPSMYQQDATVDYSWDSNDALDSSSILPNGRHTITVHAVATGGADDRVSVEVRTNNPPVTPSGLSVAADAGDVDVTWHANPEPDTMGYVVERDSGSGFVVVGESESAEFGESLVAGTYSYRVTAVRSSPTDVDGITSAPTESASITIASSASGGAGSVTTLSGRHPLGKGSAFSQRGGAGSSLAALLSGSALPATARLPDIPSPEGIEWGSYDADLPFGESAGAPPPGLRSRPVSASGPFSIVPPDGLRWVAAGLLLLVCAALAQVLAAREVEMPAPVAAGRRALARWFTRAAPKDWRRPH